MRLLVTRPAEDGAATAAALAERGHRALLAPLLQTVFLHGPPPRLDDVQAILATSANGVRALAARTGRRDLALFAVGPQTAAEAARLGFSQVRNADGDAAALAAAAAGWAAPDKGILLHVCGENAPGLLAARLEGQGFSVRRAVLYRVDAVPALPADVEKALGDGTLEGALFFSPRSAAVFAALAGGRRLETLTAFCISAAAAAALSPLVLRATRVAAAPNQGALLDLLPPAISGR